MTNQKSYNIHNLVSVNVSSAVNSFVKNQIDFQLNYFSSSTATNNKLCINVKPYNEFVPPASVAQYYQYDYIAGKLVFSKEDKVAIEYSDKIYTLYADSSILITVFIQFLLQEEGCSFIHAAGVVDKQGEAILFPASGGVGKTAIIGELVTKLGYRVLGDDLVMISKKGEAYAFPRAFILKDYHRSVYPDVFNKLGLAKRKNSTWRKFFKWSVRNAPMYSAVVEFLKKTGRYEKLLNSLPLPQDYVAAVPVTEIFGADCVHEGPARIKRVCYLERVSADSFIKETIDKDLVVTRLFSVIHDEWYEYVRTFSLLGATNILSLPRYYSATEKTLHEAVAVSSVELLQIPKQATPVELSTFFIDSL